MHKSLIIISIKLHITLILLLLNTFKDMWLRVLGVKYNPHLNTVQFVVFEVLIFHENKKILPSGDSYDLSPGNNQPTEGIIPVLVVITFSNELLWV